MTAVPGDPQLAPDVPVSVIMPVLNEERHLAEAVAGALTPLLPAAVRLRAIESLREAVATLIENGGDAPIAVSGRADVVEALQRAFGERPGITFKAGPEPEVAIRSGDTQIRSALGPWADRLAQDLGAEP